MTPRKEGGREDVLGTLQLQGSGEEEGGGGASRTSLGLRDREKEVQRLGH